MKEFVWMAYDEGNCDLFQHALEVEANDLGHALEEVATQLPDDAACCIVWRKKEQ